MIGNLRHKDTVGLLEDVIRIDPSNSATAGLGKESLTKPLPEVLADACCMISTPEGAPDRRNVIAGLPGRADAPKLFLEANVDTVPCAMLGPGSIDPAHTANEWLPVLEVRQAAEVYAEIVRRFSQVGR